MINPTPEQIQRLRRYINYCQSKGNTEMSITTLKDRIKRNRDFKGQRNLHRLLKTILINHLTDLCSVNNCDINIFYAININTQETN